jgi:hypothetical protein
MGARMMLPALLDPSGASSSAVRDLVVQVEFTFRYRAHHAVAEYLGLIPPQNVTSRHEHVTSFMRSAPVPNEDETHLEDDSLVADPLSDGFWDLLNTTARVNSEVFTELFRPVPSNLVHNWKAYEVSWYRLNAMSLAWT